MNFGPLRLEEEYQYAHISGSGIDRQQQIANDQPPYGSDSAYQYTQQVPTNPTNRTLHNTYAHPANNQSQQRVVPSQTPQSLNAAYAHGAFNPPQNAPSATDSPMSYHNNTTTFSVSNNGTGMPGIHATGGQPTLPPKFLSATLARESFPQTPAHQQDYYRMTPEGSTSSLPQAKRARGLAYREDQDDTDGDLNQDQKDANKNKL